MFFLDSNFVFTINERNTFFYFFCFLIFFFTFFSFDYIDFDKKKKSKQIYAFFFIFLLYKGRKIQIFKELKEKKNIILNELFFKFFFLMFSPFTLLIFCLYSIFTFFTEDSLKKEIKNFLLFFVFDPVFSLIILYKKKCNFFSALIFNYKISIKIFFLLLPWFCLIFNVFFYFFFKYPKFFLS